MQLRQLGSETTGATRLCPGRTPLSEEALGQRLSVPFMLTWWFMGCAAIKNPNRTFIFKVKLQKHSFIGKKSVCKRKERGNRSPCCVCPHLRPRFTKSTHKTVCQWLETKAEDALPPRHPMFTMPRTPTQLPGTCPLTPLLSPQGSRQVSSWVPVSGTCLWEEIHRSEQLRTGEGGPVEALLQGWHADHRLWATGGPTLLQRKGACALRGWHPANGEN